MAHLPRIERDLTRSLYGNVCLLIFLIWLHLYFLGFLHSS